MGTILGILFSIGLIYISTVYISLRYLENYSTKRMVPSVKSVDYSAGVN